MPVLSLNHWSTNVKGHYDISCESSAQPIFFPGRLESHFIAALGTLLRMPTLNVALHHRVSSWPASSSQPRVAQCASTLESVIYGTQHTTSGYPLNRKSASCPRAYRAFLVTYKLKSKVGMAVLNISKQARVVEIISIRTCTCTCMYASCTCTVCMLGAMYILIKVFF